MKTITMRRSRVALAICILALTGLAAACSDPGSKASSSFSQKGITVSDVWARESAMSSGNGAVYLTIENTTGVVDKLLSVSVPNSFAQTAQIHETVMGDSTSMTTLAGAAGMMSMKQVSSVTIPAGGSVTFEPGGYHVMLMGLSAPLEVGGTFEVNLGFMNAGTIKVTATVRAD